MKKPLVIAHRGASGYRPENTIEAFQLGLAQGADGIEFDLVTTKDEELIIRHENALSGTTDVATQSVFSARKRIGLVEDAQRFDWYSEDFELAEIKMLIDNKSQELSDTYSKRSKSLINSEILTKCVNSRIDGLEIATITKNIFSQKARTDLASATHLLQAAVVNIGKAKKVLRHRHLPKNRKIDRTEEMWIILRGKFEAKIFDVDNSQLLTVELSRGSLLHLHRVCPTWYEAREAQRRA